MTDSREAGRRPVRAPLRRRRRQRWAIAGGAAVCWLAAERVTGSFVTALVLLVIVGGLGAAAVAGLRAMGITRDHPWLRWMVTRPWRDGQDVLSVALRHLPEVFVVTPSGSLIAPEFVELHMNSGDLASLHEWLDPDIVSTSLTEAYEDQVARRGARFARPCQPEVYIVQDDSVPQGRYRLRRGLPESARYSPDAWDMPGLTDAGQEPSAAAGFPVGAERGGRVRQEVNVGRTVMDGMATVMEQVRPAAPVLRLVTGSSVAETSVSGARAGRGLVELELPDVPTVSRVHAIFTFNAGRWWVTSKGVNGLSVNGVQVSADHPLSDGDSIRWGNRPDAPQSRVEVG